MGFAGLHAKFDERSKIPWPALALILGVTTAVGGLAYWPLREQLIEVRLDIKERDRLSLERDRRLLDIILEARYKVERLEASRGRD